MGHILLTKVAIVSGNESVISLAVAPLSVLPEFQKQGIGGILLREAHSRASRLGYDSAVLLGHKDYYTRFGYKKASDFNIEFLFDVPEECCMAIELFPGALDGVQGIVHYSDPFRI
ncbi:GNAT family N-acetyltransferase [Coprobacter fastidiosus]|uniref:GNAT family N-acetyltransferase n=1 Tax=Coprobacter fastidiosus TaxID=1099853 RepID=UPI002675F4BE|nr:N-acetyltransferase [Coprobacter fastidiosus]